MSSEYAARLESSRLLVESHLNKLFTSLDEDIKPLAESMRYSLLAGGKRIRPALALEFDRLCGGTGSLDIACAVELLHTYSLIHDDLPCMDDDDMRRGRPSNHVVYGQWQALLSGDALQAEAFGLIACADLPDGNRVEAMRILTHAAGIGGICSGQYLDIATEGQKQEVNALLRIDQLKTSALISAACMMGCAAAGAFDDRMLAAGKFGQALGTAFQIRDDLLDIDGAAEELGKNTGSDVNRGRETLASLLGRQKATELADRLAAEAKSVLREQFQDTGYLEWLVDMLAVRSN